LCLLELFLLLDTRLFFSVVGLGVSYRASVVGNSLVVVLVVVCS
jgi:hypothetical protein